MFQGNLIRIGVFKRLLSVTEAAKFNLTHRNQFHEFHPRRAVLYVPGSDEKKISKISTFKADCVVIDCEDGVAQNKKHEARTLIRRMLDSLTSSAEVAVRVNSPGSSHIEDDLNVIFSSGTMPQCLMIPKVDTVDQMKWVVNSLHGLIVANKLYQDRPLSLVTFMESAQGLFNMRSVLQSAIDLSAGKRMRLEGVVFGSDDFSADVGIQRSDDASELIYARQKFVVTCKSFRLQAIDMVYINFKDLNGLRRQSAEGAKFGFTGKQVIHPSQIDIVQAAFSPSVERLRWARELVAAFEGHQQSGKGAFTFRGEMIDMPLLLQAKNVLRLGDLRPSPHPK